MIVKERKVFRHWILAAMSSDSCFMSHALLKICDRFQQVFVALKKILAKDIVICRSNQKCYAFRYFIYILYKFYVYIYIYINYVITSYAVIFSIVNI